MITREISQKHIALKHTYSTYDKLKLIFNEISAIVAVYNKLMRQQRKIEAITRLKYLNINCQVFDNPGLFSPIFISMFNNLIAKY